MGPLSSYWVASFNLEMRTVPGLIVLQCCGLVIIPREACSFPRGTKGADVGESGGKGMWQEKIGRVGEKRGYHSGRVYERRMKATTKQTELFPFGQVI